MKSQMAMISKLFCAAVAILAVSALVVTDVHARAGSGSSSGSRGSRTFSAPPATNTAPKATAPIEKSIAQPGKASPTAGAATARPSLFGGMKGLLLGGLFAAALGSIFGFGALASVLGFVVQGLLIGGIAFLIYTFVRNRMGAKPGLATATAGAAPAQAQQPMYRQAAMPVGGSSPALNVAPADFDAFERLLGDVQTDRKSVV